MKTPKNEHFTATAHHGRHGTAHHGRHGNPYAEPTAGIAEIEIRLQISTGHGILFN